MNPIPYCGPEDGSFFVLGIINLVRIIGKIRYHCSIETISLVLGIVSSVLSSISILGLTYCIVVIFLNVIYSYSGSSFAFVAVLYSTPIIAFLFITIVNLMFSVFFVHGVIKKNANHIQKYSVYSEILMVLSVTMTFVITLILLTFVPISLMIPPLSIYGAYITIHSLLLYMANKTYKKFTEELVIMPPQEMV